MRRRPSARLLIFDKSGYVLLFRYAFTKGVLSGRTYWSTPGGGLEEGETFENAARRELMEETGIAITVVGPCVAEREFILQLITGEEVVAQERYFAIRVQRQDISYAGWTDLEKQFMVEHRWWLPEELRATTDTVLPENLADLFNQSLPVASPFG
jgi:8-oxo-dGTP diphosphatase